MLDLQYTAGSLPVDQQAIRLKCFPDCAEYIPFPPQEAGQTILSRLEQVANRFPQNTALRSRARELNYAELIREVNGLASCLTDLELKHGEPIGLFFNHGVTSIVAQLAVLRCGAVRVALDSTHPAQRLRQIVGNCGIRFILTNYNNLGLAKGVGSWNAEIINIDDFDQNSDACVDLPLLPEAGTLIGYTSGSTGEPKGVLKNHLNEMHSVMRVTNSIGLSANDRLLYLRPTSTIALHALLNGATYYPVDLRRDGNMQDLAQWIREEKITVYRSAVSIFRTFARTLGEKIDFPDLRLILLQGEPVYRTDVELYKTRFNEECVLVSSLGVSELGDYAHYYIDKESSVPSVVPGGYPLLGANVSLLTAEGRIDPKIQRGELGVQGPFVGVSAWDRPDVTQRMFCKDAGTLTYRTGDMGMIRNDGCVVHLGRKDFQVKVRGHRVDLQRVESALHDLDGVSKAATIGHVDSSGDVQLVAYLVPEGSSTPSSRVMRNSLKSLLPDYMVPARYVLLDELPMTLTGKVDRKSLPIPGNERPNLDVEFEPPRDSIESEIAAIWKEVLNLDDVGVMDTFLDLGGDSLKATRIHSRVVETFGVEMLLKQFFQAPTIAALAVAVRESMPASEQLPIRRAQRVRRGRDGAATQSSLDEKASDESSRK